MTQPDQRFAKAQRLDCTICGYGSRRLFRKSGYWMRGCDHCQHRFTEVEPTPDQIPEIYSGRYFYGTGPGYLNYLAEANRLRQKGQDYARLLEPYMWPPGTLLDVGAAAGLILRGFVDQGWQGVGLEPNQRIADYGRHRLGLKIQTGTLEAFKTSDRYDLVTLIQVLPHFYDLEQALQSAQAVTKDGGYWLIETQNPDSCLARLCGHQWLGYTPPSQLRWFSPAGLQAMVAHYGLQEIARGRPLTGVNSAFTKSWLRYKLAQHWWGKLPTTLLGGIPDRGPLAPLGSDYFWVLFQKND